MVLTLPVSSSMDKSEVSFLPTNTRSSSALSNLNGDNSTSCDMDRERGCSGLVGVAMTYISPLWGSIM